MDNVLLGTVVKGRYRLDERLGIGGFGDVYLARDLQLRDRPVVVKILHEKVKSDQWFQRKFSQEIEALSRINHPGVVSVIDAGELPSGEPFMVQQFVEGSTLRGAIKPGGMDLPRVANIIRSAGQALSAAHQRGIFHRDLKPENIMLRTVGEGQEHVTLIDFGIASVVDSENSAVEKTKVTGTFTYMAPEQFDGKPVAASDTYALGVIAFEMLAGVPPSAEKPLFEVLLMQREGSWPKISELRPSVPARAQSLILKALAYRPEDRFASARDFGEEFAQALGQPLAPVGTSSASVTHPFAPRIEGRTLVWILSALTTIVLILALWIWNSRRLEDRPAALRSGAARVGESQKLAYWISVQPFRNSEPFGNPFVISHERVFQTEDRIFLTVASPHDGFLYIIDQEPILREGLPSYRMMFPTPTANGGVAKLAAGTPVRIPEEPHYFAFTEQLGMERVWLVWSAKEVAALAGIEAANTPLPSAPRKRIWQFLQENESIRPSVEVSEASMSTLLSRPGSQFVHRIDINHR